MSEKTINGNLPLTKANLIRRINLLKQQTVRRQASEKRTRQLVRKMIGIKSNG